MPNKQIKPKTIVVSLHPRGEHKAPHAMYAKHKPKVYQELLAKVERALADETPLPMYFFSNETVSEFVLKPGSLRSAIATTKKNLGDEIGFEVDAFSALLPRKKLTLRVLHGLKRHLLFLTSSLELCEEDEHEKEPYGALLSLSKININMLKNGFFLRA